MNSKINELFKLIEGLPEMVKEVGKLLTDQKEAKDELKKKSRDRMWLANENPLPKDVTDDPLGGIKAYTDALNNAPIICRQQKGGYNEFFNNFASIIGKVNYVSKRRLS